jgi:KTSC domain
VRPCLYMKPVKVGSAAIEAVTYDETQQTLDVEFRGNGKYHYFNVPVSIYRALLKAEPAGAFGMT